MIYNAEFETMPRDDIDQLQIERLQTTMHRVYRNVSFYKQKFDEYRINPEKIKTMADLSGLPLTTKEDLMRSYPYGMFAVPLRDIVRIHATAGSTEKHIVVGYTKNDIKNWSELVARLLTAGGITQHDVVQIALNYSLFTAGFGYHYGAEAVGASVIPSSTTGNMKKQIMIMKDYKTTALITTPSYALSLANALAEMKIHPEELNLKYGLFCAEPWTEEIRDLLENRLRLIATDNYGLGEIMGPGVAGECQEKNGLHINEDHFIVEIIDPATLKTLAPGEEGEVVFTTITKEGLPLIRYRTGDIGRLMEEPCKCGRTFIRMSRITKIADNMLFINGIKVFPSLFEETLREIKGIEPYCQVVVDRENQRDTLSVRLALVADFNLDDIKRLLNFKAMLKERLESILDFPLNVTFVESKTLRQDNGDTYIKVVDRRK